MEVEQVKVSALATEFEIQNSIVVSELKKIGVWVPSPNTMLDRNIADRIRRRLQTIIELSQQQQEKSKEKKEKKKTSALRTRKTIKQLGTPRKRAKKTEAGAITNPLSTSLKPRKGKASYQKMGVLEKEVSQKVEVTIDDEPIIEKVEAQVPAELLEEALKKALSANAIDKTPGTLTQPGEARPGTEVRKPRRAPRRVKMVTKTEEERLDPSSAPGVKISEISTSEPEDSREETGKSEMSPQLETPSSEDTPVSELQTSQEETELQEVVFSERITVKGLAKKLDLKANQIIKELLERGVMATINQSLERPVVEELCELHGFIVRFVSFEEAAAEVERVDERPEDIVARAPVVTVMGHVDHGKTSVLDAIRKTRIAESEAGGITQHIGASEVEVKGQKIIFIDTPGHEAFTRMRARGAQATDIVVLVVAADDGVMPQTIEAIDHARAANVPIIVAINKIDKSNAQPDRVKQTLTEHKLVAEEWGGDTVMVEISATEKTNLDLLLEMILLTADLLELRANPNRAASGIVLEAKMDKGRGAVSTILVQNGTLEIGHSFIAGTGYGKIRAMFNDLGKPAIKAGPGSATEILGLQILPQAGDLFQVVEDPGKAREMIEYRQEQQKSSSLGHNPALNLDDLYSKMQEGNIKELPIVLKGDARGSVEVVQDVLEKLSGEKVQVKIIHKGMGAISESDVLLASATGAIVLGFNVRPERNAQDAADQEGVDVRLYTVIYDIAEEIKKAMIGLLDPTWREVDLGRAEVREVFRIPKFGRIAGSYVEEGTIQRNAQTRLLRDNVVVYEGKIDSLRRFKEDVNEVRFGYECGISIANFDDIKIGDVIEVFEQEEITPDLN